MGIPIDPSRPTTQLHLKRFPTKLRIELNVLAARRQQDLVQLVPELLALGIKAMKRAGAGVAKSVQNKSGS